MLSGAAPASTGCAATQAAVQKDASSRLDAEQDVKHQFSRNYWCPAGEVSVTDVGSSFEASGCNKSARYRCEERTGSGAYRCSEQAGLKRSASDEVPRRPRSLLHPDPVPPGPPGGPR